MRGPGQVHVPPGGPSTSGRSESPEKEDRFEPGAFRVSSEPVHFNDRKYDDTILPRGLWYEKNGHYQLLDGVSITAIGARGFIIGIADGGYIRPIYNENHKMVVVYEEDKRVREITPEQAERLLINRPIPDRTPTVHNVPNEPNMSAGPSRPSENLKGRSKNKKRHN